MEAFKTWLKEGDTTKPAARPGQGATAEEPRSEPQAAGPAARVITPSGRRIGVQPEVVEAAGPGREP